MKAIDFRKPKYVLPLILLPFLFLGYYLVTQMDNKKDNAAMAKDSLLEGFNASVPGVGKEVEDEDIKNKFDAYRDAYKRFDKQSPLAGITPNAPEKEEEDILGFSDDDRAAMRAKQTLDSINQVLNDQQSDLDRDINAMRKSRNAFSSNTRESDDGEKNNQKAFMEELKRASKNEEEAKKNTEADPYEQQMKLFREQMRFADSLEKAGSQDGNVTNGNIQAIQKKDFNPKEDTSFKPLPVTANPSFIKPSFNTIKSFNRAEAIEAIIDQDEKAMAGTRIRIRLLQDMYVGGQLIPKGTYLYAVVTGFQTSRLNLSISQVFYKNESYPVSLDVFDNDGYLGLYVPGSSFREFTKAIGTQGTNGLSSVQMSDNSNPLSGLVSQLFRTTTTTAANLIKKEKAFVKHNYIVYLKENKQR